jgi:cytochrome c553
MNAAAYDRFGAARSTALLVIALCVAPFAAGANPDELSYCTVCHGTNGNGNIAIRAPKLAGLPTWYVRAQLDAFRLGWRGVADDDAPGHEMQPVAAAFANDAVAARAVAYVATFETRAAVPTVVGDTARGGTLYAPCAACHGAAGTGNEALGAPPLAGQSDWYLAAQLRNFRDGSRGAHPDDARGATMRPFGAALDDAAIADVVAYIDALVLPPVMRSDH